MDNLANKPLQPKTREKWGELFQVSQQEHLTTTATPFLSWAQGAPWRLREGTYDQSCIFGYWETEISSGGWWIERYLNIKLLGRRDVKDDSRYLVNILLVVWLLYAYNIRGRELGRSCSVVLQVDRLTPSLGPALWCLVLFGFGFFFLLFWFCLFIYFILWI